MKKKVVKVQDTKKNGKLELQEAITMKMTISDKDAYEGLLKSEVDEYAASVITPLMNKAYNVINKCDDVYNMLNAIMFVGEKMNNKDMAIVSEQGGDAAIFFANKVNAAYSSVYTEIYHNLGVIFAVFINKVKELANEELDSEYFGLTHNLTSLLIGYSDITSGLENVSYDITEPIPNNSPKFQPMIVRLSRTITDMIINPTEANSLLFFNTILPTYINEIVLTCARFKCMEISYGREDRRYNKRDNDGYSDMMERIDARITNDLLPVLHNNIITLYNQYIDLIKSPAFNSIFTIPENVNFEEE